MLIRFLTLAATAALAACTTTDSAQTDCSGSQCTAIGERYTVDDFTVTPVQLLEDSRCPVEAECVWEGQVRIRAIVERGNRTEEVEISTSQPVEVASGTLALTQTWPVMSAQHPIEDPQSYRFVFDWQPHIMERLY